MEPKPRTATLAIETHTTVSEENKIPKVVFNPAYDGGLCNLNQDDWPLPVVFDITGMEPVQVVPIVRDHDQNQKVGQTDSIAYGNDSIKAVGKMIHLGIDESADKVLALWKRGAQLQASIHTDLIQPDDTEVIPEGCVCVVNGREFKGPIELVRRTSLREISIVTVGANSGTAVEIEAKLPKEDTMAKKNFFGSKKTKERVARCADEEKQAQCEGEEKKDCACEGEEAFIEWLAEKAIDPDGLSDENYAALKAMYCAEGEEGEEAECAEDGEPVSEGGGDGTSEAGGAQVEEEKKEGQASFSGRSVRRVKRVASASSPVTYRGPGSAEINAARVAEASMLVSAGLKPERLSRQLLGEEGYTDNELNEAVSSKNRNLSPMGLLFRAGMCSGSNFRDLSALRRNMNSAKFAAAQASLGGGRVAQAAGNLGTVDVPNVFANVMYKSMLVAFKEYPDPTDDLSKVSNAQDFRPLNFWTIDTDGKFEAVKANGELNVLKIKDAGYTNQVKLYGAEIRYDYTMMINDDQGALTELPKKVGMNFRAQKQLDWWGTLVGDLSNATHVTSNPTFSISGLDTAWGQMGSVYSDAGVPILMSPKFVVVPTALGSSARMIASAIDIDTAGGSNLTITPNKNPYANGFTPIVTPFIGGASKYSGSWGNAGWAVIADPTEMPAMLMSYLNGNSQPTMETKNGDFEVEGVRIGTWWGYGANIGDRRGYLFSNGSGS